MTREEAKVFMLQFNTDKRLNPSEHEAVRVAIKALEQEPCDNCDYKEWLKGEIEQEPCEDCISRKDTCTAIIKRLGIKDETFLLEAERAIYQQILAMPPVTPQPKTEWIPISERMPEDRDWYLGVFKEPDTGWINPLPFICDYVGSKTKATTKEYWILRGFTDRDEHIDYYFNLECVAWMPLPKPHKAESEGKQ